jgi:LAO/AO transport system kinase
VYQVNLEIYTLNAKPIRLKSRLSIGEYIEGITNGDRVVLAKAITLVESQLSSDRELTEQVLDKILPLTGNSIRIGITGVPGVGKSTFIEYFGKYCVDHHQKQVAVLTVDPSSQITKGSILGDKTRMEELSKNPKAFIRPSSSGEALGGVTNRTRESILLCEAAGFDLIIVETVGVGQSETAVKKTVDFFLLLMLAGAGDELQGIKKGIVEMADTIAITKADGDNKLKATEAQSRYLHALHLLRADASGWKPTVVTCSALTGEGIDTIWFTIQQFCNELKKNQYFQKNRQQQQVDWMQEYFHSLVKSEITKSPLITEQMRSLENQVLNNSISAPNAAKHLFDALMKSLNHS